MTERRHLPIGTVVRVKDVDVNLMINSLFPIVNKSDKQGYFDFGAVTLPLGAVSEESIFFNKDDIDEIIYLGYVDVSFQEIDINYDEMVSKITVPQFTVKDFNQ
ncbi:DUF4176 domain-containing protein [Streptococcus pluranimalium]|uniref:DUF4176 domain-containing protein n=1 Tax=Streptococcus pluranimalium TaxID=82348 RepID=A0A345VJK1_9STRE|nr:DUF4176 domain-containing protein [Streptococcus pluranimalium]AXJ12903.1 hypothetical protein Sp14A_09820 [Streptococcus pluranimalium]